VARYKPKYTKPGAVRPALFRRLRWVSLAGILHKKGRPGKGKSRVTVVARQRSRQSGYLSRIALLALLLVIGLSVGGWYYHFLLKKSDIFRLTTVSVQGNRMTRKAEILELASIEQGINLLGFDIDLAEERILRHPWVERVDILRSWPSSLEVRVHEYRPLAMVNVENEQGGDLYYIDQHGKIFAQVESSQDLDFPVITGLDSVGAVIADKGLAAEAFSFLLLAARGNPIMPLQTISEVHVSPEKGLVVYLVDRPFPIYMGYNNITTRYYQLVKLLERLYRKRKVKEIKEIRMDYYEDRILVAKVEPYK